MTKKEKFKTYQIYKQSRAIEVEKRRVFDDLHARLGTKKKYAYTHTQ